jgi:hypothetical protein
VTFITERLNTAIYLHASRSLEFIGCRLNGPHKIEFVFADPDNLGPQCEMEFESGKAVSAMAMLASQKYLRRLMTAKQNEGKRAIGAMGDEQHAAVRVG